MKTPRPTPTRSSPGRRHARATLLALPPVRLLPVILLCGACAQSAPFDSLAHLRQDIEERLDPAVEVEIPFELPSELLQQVEGRIGLAGGEAERVQRTEDFIFGTIGLQYALTPTRSAVDTFEAAEGNCLSFVNLFVALTRHQRINSFFVEVTDQHSWSYRQGMVLSQGHIVAGHYHNGQLRLADFLPGRAKSYRRFQPIDDLTATAHYYNNLGAEALLDGDPKAAERHLRIATRLAPGFVRGLNNLGVALTRMERHQEAAAVFEQGLAEEPEDAAVLSNLARSYQLQGRPDEAGALLARIEGQRQASPFFFIYQGERSLADGDLTQALGYMRQALKRASEIPEVHVGLAKVYLSLGELRSAGHHLERALRLDATHEEARRWAKLLAARRGEGSTG